MYTLYGLVIYIIYHLGYFFGFHSFYDRHFYHLKVIIWLSNAGQADTDRTLLGAGQDFKYAYGKKCRFTVCELKQVLPTEMFCRFEPFRPQLNERISS